MNKYEIRTQKKKDAIVSTALTLFREKGYTNVSINEIASFSGISSVSIYNYFNNKEGLVKECVNILMRQGIEMTNALLEEKISFKEKLLKVFTICSDTHVQLLGEYFSPEALKDNVLVNLYNENANKLRLEILLKFIELGKKEGAISSSISTETISEFMYSFLDNQLSWEANSNFKEKGLELIHLLLYGLIGK